MATPEPCPFSQFCATWGFCEECDPSLYRAMVIAEAAMREAGVPRNAERAVPYTAILHILRLATGRPVPEVAADGQVVVADAELDRKRALNDAAWGSVWLHGRWSWLTKNMTTPQREHAADCVARWSAALNADDPNLEPGEPEGLRWWREPEPEPCTCRGLPLPLGQTCNAHQIKETRHDA